MWEDPFLSIAIYILWWWMAFFVMLPMGVRNLDESGLEAKGHDRGAPSTPNLQRKALWAAGIAAGAWILTAIVLQALYYGR